MQHRHIAQTKMLKYYSDLHANLHKDYSVLREEVLSKYRRMVGITVCIELVTTTRWCDVWWWWWCGGMVMWCTWWCTDGNFTLSGSKQKVFLEEDACVDSADLSSGGTEFCSEQPWKPIYQPVFLLQSTSTINLYIDTEWTMYKLVYWIPMVNWISSFATPSSVQTTPHLHKTTSCCAPPYSCSFPICFELHLVCLCNTNEA